MKLSKKWRKMCPNKSKSQKPVYHEFVALFNLTNLFKFSDEIIAGLSLSAEFFQFFIRSLHPRMGHWSPVFILFFVWFDIFNQWGLFRYFSFGILRAFWLSRVLARIVVGIGIHSRVIAWCNVISANCGLFRVVWAWVNNLIRKI